ncbi:MAG: FadR/GntR family transcriptional regulator [Clostridia bacterium]
MTSSGLKQIKKSTMAELIIDQVLQMIDQGIFVPGQKLPSEKELLEILCVSRPTVREAMRSLMTMGLVEIRCGDGTYLNDSVKLISEHFKNTNLLRHFSYNELIDTRLLLECEMARLAALNATEQDLQNLEKAFADVAGTMDTSDIEFHRMDARFHMAIAECSKNRFMKEILSALQDLLVMMNVSVPSYREIRQQSCASSREIVNAIKTGDSQLAQQIMYQHIADTASSIRRMHHLETTETQE